MFSDMPTIAAAGRAFRSGTRTPRELVEFCAARIESLEPRLRAWVALDLQEARREADRQGELLRRGDDLGPLQGIPLGIKDLIDIAGWPTQAGSPLRRRHRASHDAPLIARLRQAGAILLGKTVTTEFACFDPPPTRNPWHVEHTPGGSSSGSAVAVAVRMCPAALGSQTGGSIIRPASFCGVAGLKPTFGRVGIDGVVPVSRHLDHVGPLARTVADLAVVFAALDGSPSPASGGLRNGEPPGRPAVRLVVFREFFRSAADGAVLDALDDALARLVAGGASVEECPLPLEFSEVHRRHRDLMAYETAQVHLQDFSAHADAYGPHVAGLIREGLDIASHEADSQRYATALIRQQEFRAVVHRLLGDHTVALMPSTLSPAPGIDTTGDPRFNSPWSFAGTPAVTIPCGLSGEGLPCGLQLVGGLDTDYQLLDVAAWCEQQIQFTAHPPL